MFLAPVQNPSPVAATIESLLAAHRALARFEARIERGTGPAMTLARAGDRVLVRIAEPSHPGDPIPTLRTVLAAPASAWAYDEALNELLPLKPQGRTPAERIAAALGGRDDALTFLLDPPTLARYLRPLARRPGWTVAGRVLTLKERGTRTTIEYDPATRRIVRVASTSGGTAAPGGRVASGFDLRFRYGAYGLAGFVPREARQVARFTDLRGSVRSSDLKAAEIVARFVRKNARLTEADVTMEADAGVYRLLVSGERMRQTGPRLDLGYDGRTLTVLDRRTGRAYRGPARRADVRRAAVKLGEPLVPLASAFLAHDLPFANLFFPARVAKVGGRIGEGPSAADILTLTTAGTRETVFVRGDGLATSLEAEIRDGSRIVSLSRQRFTYRDPSWRRGGAASLPLPAPKGAVLPLPKAFRTRA